MMRVSRKMFVVSAVAVSLVAVTQAQKKPAVDPALLAISRTGSVLHSPGITAIFWGPEWTNPAFAADIVTGLDTMLAGYSGSAYANAAAEYSDRSGQITPFTTYLGHLIDTAAAPAAGSLTTASVVDEVCKMTNNSPNPDDVYVVFTSTDHGTSSCTFHTWGTCGTKRNPVPVQVAAVPYASGVLGTGCDALQDTETGHSLALAQMANITAHALVQTIVNPRGTGWKDGNGDEIAEKCIRVFPPSPGAFPVFSNGSVWKIQAQWSNAAYLAGTGASNALGQSGCVW